MVHSESDRELTQQQAKAVRNAFNTIKDAIQSALADLASVVRSVVNSIRDIFDTIDQIILRSGDVVLYCPETGDPFANEDSLPAREVVTKNGVITFYHCRRCGGGRRHALFHDDGQIDRHLETYRDRDRGYGHGTGTTH